MKQQTQSGTVLIQSEDAIAVIDDAMVRRMRGLALGSPDGRARLCLHHALNDPVQEMILSLTEANCYPAHRHRDKAESYHILDGDLGILIFDDAGKVLHRHLLSSAAPESGKALRIGPMLWHAVIALSPVVVFHETTSGPFQPGGSEVAGFCPEGIAERRSFFRAATQGMLPTSR
jgi:cupin fold WbuC family metalloprotein